MTGVFLQVRLDSSRLPNKALLELGGKSVIEHAMYALKRVPVAIHAIVTDASSRELLEPRATKCGFETFVGPRDDVLERYVLAARYFGVQTVVRATGDNPLVSWELAGLAIREFRRQQADYFGFDGPPLGTGVEVVRTSALERAVRESSRTYDREHVTSFLYRNPEIFRAVRVQAPPVSRYPQAQVTLDTPEDYNRLCEIFATIYDGTPVSLFRLVNYLSARGTASFQAQDVNDYSSGA